MNGLQSRAKAGAETGLAAMPTIESIFKQAIILEMKAHAIYIEFARLFRNFPTVAAFWKDLAADENQHAHELRQLLRKLSSHQRNLPAEKRMLEKLEQVRRLAGMVSPQSIHDLLDAYQIAHELEYSELNYLFKILAEKFIPSPLQNRILINQVAQHQGKLSEFGLQFNDRQAMREIPVS